MPAVYRRSSNTWLDGPETQKSRRSHTHARSHRTALLNVTVIIAAFVADRYRSRGAIACHPTALMPQSWRIGNALCHDGPMEPEEADVAIRLSAREYASGSDRPPVIWSALNSHLTDLCRDEPLDGDFLRLFQALALGTVRLPRA